MLNPTLSKIADAMTVGVPQDAVPLPPKQLGAEGKGRWIALAKAMRPGQAVKLHRKDLPKLVPYFRREGYEYTTRQVHGDHVVIWKLHLKADA